MRTVRVGGSRERIVEETIYLYSAVAGSTLVVLQIILQVFGFFGGGDFEGHSDMDLGDVADSHDTHLDGAEGHGNIFFGILSFKALCAFAGIFGLVGLTLLGTDLNTQARVAIAFSSGMAGMFLVGWMMRGMVIPATAWNTRCTKGETT